MSLHFDQLFRKKLQKVPHFVKKHEKSSIWPNLYNFSNKLPCLWISMNFSRKSSKKCLASSKSTRNHRSGQIFITFRTNYHVFAFRWTFQKKVAKSASFREKARKTIDLAKTSNFSRKLPCLGIFMNFSARSCKKCLISWKSTRNHRSGQNFATFRTNYHVFAFQSTFLGKVSKSASFREKARKTIDLVKTCNFSNKLPCFGVSMNFSTNSCRNCLISWKSTKTHRFGQNYATFSNKLPCFGVSMNFSAKGCKKWLNSWKSTRSHRSGQNFAAFRKTTMSLHFDELFRKKLQKVPHFVKKHEKSSIWPNLYNFSNKLPCLWISMNFSRKSCKKFLVSSKSTRNYRSGQIFITFSNKLPCFGVSMNFSAKGCKKCLISWKSTRNHRSGKNFATFRTNYYVFAFRSTFQEKVAKSASFREKARKIIDLAKTMQLFRTNYHVFAFRSTFREKVAKSSSFRETARKIIDLAKALQLLEQATMSFSFWWTFKKKVAKSASSREKARNIIDFVNLQISEKTTMFWRFDEHCSKKLQKAARAVKKHEKSSIWPNLCNFSNKLRCFCISMNFQGKVAKSASFREKARKLIDLAKTLQLFEQTTMFWHFDEVFSKKLQKVPHFVKKHEKSSILTKLAAFPANYHVLTLWWTFQRKVAESASFSEKTLKIIDWAKTCNFFEQSTMFMRFDELFSKRLQKMPRFVKKHEHSSIWPKLATFRTNYHVLAFRWTFREKNAKSGPFREKARTLIDLAKTCNFSKKLPCFGISMIIAGKSCKKVEKVAHLVKNDEKSSIWPKLATFRGNYHVSAFSSTFQQKVSHFVKKHEKSSFGSCLAHS